MLTAFIHDHDTRHDCSAGKMADGKLYGIREPHKITLDAAHIVQVISVLPVPNSYPAHFNPPRRITIQPC